jgi:hypothetical protein
MEASVVVIVGMAMVIHSRLSKDLRQSSAKIQNVQNRCWANSIRSLQKKYQ